MRARFRDAMVGGIAITVKEGILLAVGHFHWSR
jgi:hypothetical protein